MTASMLKPEIPAYELTLSFGSYTKRQKLLLICAPIILVLVVLAALSFGRFNVPYNEVARMLAGQILPVGQTWTQQEEQIVLGSRLPRVLLALVVGGGLALAGATLQAVFRNPLVSPQVIGVSSGASLGGVLALLFGLGAFWLVGFSFIAGMIAIWLVMRIGRTSRGSSLLMIVLGGIIVSSLFSALVSLVTYLADPYTTLPSIVFWLMGSLAAATLGKVAVATIPILAGSVMILALRWRINILSLGDDDAASLGVNPHRLRLLLLAMVAIITAGAVAVSGIIGWIGLVVPHMARLLVGPDHKIQLPMTMILGAGYLAVIDTLSRTITSAELPVGILTAIIGAPVFIMLLRSVKQTSGLRD